MGKLSGGQRRRLGFALALAGDPDLLFLDEPTVGMDVAARHAFWARIGDLSALGKTIIFTTHLLEEANAVAGRIVVIDHGRIVASGTPVEVKSRVAGKRLRVRGALTEAHIATLPGAREIGRTTGRTVRRHPGRGRRGLAPVAVRRCAAHPSGQGRWRGVAQLARGRRPAPCRQGRLQPRDRA